MKVFKSNTVPDHNWVEIGDLWIDPDRGVLVGQPQRQTVFMCTDIVDGPEGRRATYQRLAPEVQNIPPDPSAQLSLVFSGTTPNRSISLVATDTDGSTHTVAEIVY